MTAASFKSGAIQAILSSSNIDPSVKWIQKGVRGSANALDFINKAFQLYYDSINSIKQCPNANHKQKMLKQLKDAATDGYDDLYDEFDYLYNNSVWMNSDSKTYSGSTKTVYDGPASAPIGIVNFMESVDGKMAQLWKSASSYQTSTKKLINSGENKDWETVGKIIGTIKNYGGKAQFFFWMAPNVKSHLGRVVGYTDVMGKIHSGLDTYQKAKNANFPKGTAVAIAALKVSVEWVPVLGELYGKAVDLLPTLAVSFGQSVKDRQRRLLNIARMT